MSEKRRIQRRQKLVCSHHGRIRSKYSSAASDLILIAMVIVGFSITRNAEASPSRSTTHMSAIHASAPDQHPIVKARNPTGARSVFAQELAMNSKKLVDRWNVPIEDASKRVGIPTDWIRAVLMEESGGRTMMAENAPITSSMGAMGLMQVMPDTWREMQHIYHLGTDPYEPRDNILAGAALLRSLYWEYGYPGMFAAYNDGPGMIEAHRRLKQMLPHETAAYVLDIASILRTGTRSAARTAANYAATHPSYAMDPVETDSSMQLESPQAYPEDDDDDYYKEN